MGAFKYGTEHGESFALFFFAIGRVRWASNSLSVDRSTVEGTRPMAVDVIRVTEFQLDQLNDENEAVQFEGSNWGLHNISLYRSGRF